MRLSRRLGPVLVLAVLLPAVAVTVQSCRASGQDDSLHLALVGPMTGTNPANGRSFVEGVKLCVDRVNRDGGIHGKRVVVDVYDDQNDPALAREAALSINADNRALAVIGHNYSSCSLAGGQVYKGNGIPAITPSSTAPSVTADNPWYFRTIFSDSLEGSFLANYIAKVFRRRQLAIIAEQATYGSELARIVADSCTEQGVEVAHQWSFDANAEDLDQRLSDIITELAQTGYRGLVFLAVHAPEGIKLVTLLREADLNNTLLTPNSLASRSFRQGFDELAQEKLSPGYFTNGIYVSSPLLFDSAGELGQRFAAEYTHTYGGSEPDWRAAFAYDAALVLVKALAATDPTGTPSNLPDERARLRDHLASLTSIDLAVEGVTGYNYFDSKGDSQKPIFLGMYQGDNIISTLTQFQEIPNIRQIANLDRAMAQGHVNLINDHYMYRINVVYVGMQLIEISNLDMSKLTCSLDFKLWFRSQGAEDVENIEFLNAAEPLELGEPIETATSDRFTYHLYRVRGRFKVDFVLSDSFEEHIVGVSFTHRNLTRENLIYVTDVIGMGLSSAEALLERMQQDQVLSPATGWSMHSAQFFQDVAEKESQGDPRLIGRAGGPLKYSRFNAKLVIEREQFGLRRELSTEASTSLLVLGVVLVLALFVSSRTQLMQRLSRLVWPVQVLGGLLVVLTAETVIINNLIDSLPRYQLELIVRTFDILWWLVPAFYLNLGAETFIWTPLETRANQKIPAIVRRFFAFIVYLLCFFGIIAFVYNQKITSLLATSGVIAMIIGLAIQINISNIFSGIALNLERPFTVGDWIKIGDGDETKVLDMTWRTTRLLNRDNTVLNVPNSIAAESKVTNYHRPDDTYELWIYFHVDPAVLPERVIKIALDALSSHPLVLKEPLPGCRFLGFTEYSGEYVAVPVIKDYAKKNVYRGALMTHLWAELHRAGIQQALAAQELYLLRGAKSRGAQAARPLDILQNVEIFAPLSDQEKAHLTSRMERRSFAAGETIVTQGEEGDSLFIITEGVVGVWIRVDDDKTIEVDRMGAGTFFGEMALLTGEPRTATISATTETVLFEITKADISELITQRPAIVKLLSEELTKRTINREAKKSSYEASKTDEKALYTRIFEKIQSLFGAGKKG